MLQGVTSFIPPWGSAPAPPAHPGPSGKVLPQLFAFVRWRNSELHQERGDAASQDSWGRLRPEPHLATSDGP